jgi:general L-amino acid transport system permease protein
MMKKKNEVQSEDHQISEMAPPIQSVGIVGWLRANLFSSWINTLLTIALGIVTFLLVKNIAYWLLFTAQWTVITANFKLLMAGQYPVEELWRVWVSLSLVSILLGLSWGLWRGTIGHIAISMMVIFGLTGGLLTFISMGSKLWLFGNIAIVIVGFFIARKVPKLKKVTIAGWLLLFPIVILLLNGFGVLNPVSTNVWGGFLLTLLLAVVAIVFSFPLGVLLALGRRSKLPIIRWFSIGYIELIRGVPLITILFVGQLMIPLFLGHGVQLNNVLRAMIGFTLFSAAYQAENIRGGLQSLPRGQTEAAQALGLNNTYMTTFIILPQALRAVIPAMVGQFIGIFKDTSLVAIVGLIDLLGMGKTIVSNPLFLGRYMEVYMFVAFVFFIFCFMLSYASRRIESALGIGTR